jgi:predicted GIY-YIG superfamily endonuclease
MNQEYFLYLLINSTNNYTYVGITNNMERRLRMHNGEIKGGAKYTSANKKNGIWELYGFIYGLDKSLALSIEKKIHIASRNNYKIYGTKIHGKTSLEKRINCINFIIEDTKIKLGLQLYFFII